MNDKHYVGGVCKKCGTSVKYKSGSGCVECARLRHETQKNDPAVKARRKEVQKQYYHKRRDDLLAHMAQYREGHKEEIAAFGKQWREENKEQRKEKRRRLWTVEDRVNQRLIAIKARAKKKGQEFTITANDCPPITHCPVYGFELDWAAPGQQPNSPSLDRFDSNKGYVPGNVHWISWKANNAKNSSTVEELEALISWMRKVNTANEESTSKTTEA